LIHRVVFTGDVFRPGPQGQYSWQCNFIETFFHLLGPIVSAAVEADVEVASPHAGDLDQRTLYPNAGDALDMQAWVPLFTGSAEIPAEAQAVLAKRFNGAVVVGFEMPAAMLAWLDGQGLTYIDFAICPLQFMDDIALIMRSNHAGVNKRLADYCLDEAYIRMQAGLVQAACRWVEQPPERDLTDFALVCSSTATDRNLILGDRFITFHDHADHLADLCARHETVVFKPHPYSRSEDTERRLLASFPNVRFTNSNVYLMMSRAPGLKSVTSLCSSASLEARFFGHTGVHLVHPPARLRYGRGVSLEPNFSASIHCDFWKTTFWADVLEPVLNPRRGSPKELSDRPNRLRTAIAAFGPAAISELVPVVNAYRYHEAQASRTDMGPPQDPIEP
jgi:hypothetical protein